MSTTGEKTIYYCKRYGFFCAGANEWGECNTTACWNSNTGRIVIEEETSKHVKVSDYIKREPRTFIEIADDLNDLVSELNDKIVESIREKNADVAPVRHGRWIDTDRYGFPVMECSECGAQTGTLNFPYCFNCGAQMDEEDG